MNDNLLQRYSRYIKYAPSFFIEGVKDFFKLTRWGVYGAAIAISGKLLFDFGGILNANLSDRRSYISVIGEVASEFSIIMSSFLAFMLGLIAENPYTALGLLVFLMAIWNREKYPAFLRAFILFVWVWVLLKLNLNVDEGEGKHLFALAFSIAGIIATSIAIIFAFSTFILQSAANLFSYEYSILLAQRKKDKVIFWALVLLSITSCFLPFIIDSNESILKSLLFILSLAFCLVYELYAELKKGVNLKDALNEITEDSIKSMKKNIKIAKNPSLPKKKWAETHFGVAEKDIKHLKEMGIKLSAKNEISGYSLILKCICDLHLKCLELDYNSTKDSAPINSRNSIFTSNVFGELQLMYDYFVQERKKENIYYLLDVYHTICLSILRTEHINNRQDIIILAFAQYRDFAKNLPKPKTDWGPSIINGSHWLLKTALLQEKKNSFIAGFVLLQTCKIRDITISSGFSLQILGSASVVKYCFEEIKAGWENHKTDFGLWGILFENLEKNILSLSSLKHSDMYIASGILDIPFANFHSWQKDTLSLALKLKDKKEYLENLFSFMMLLKKLGGVFEKASVQHGLNTEFGKWVIQSVETNLDLIYKIRQTIEKEAEGKDSLNKIYKIHINIFDSFFNKDNESKINSDNIIHALTVIQKGIVYNLEYEFCDINALIDKHIELAEKCFKEDTDKRSEVSGKMLSLSEAMMKHGKSAEAKRILSKKEDLESLQE